MLQHYHSDHGLTSLHMLIVYNKCFHVPRNAVFTFFLRTCVLYQTHSYSSEVFKLKVL